MTCLARAVRPAAGQVARLVVLGAATLSGCGPTPPPRTPGLPVSPVPPSIQVGRADGAGPVRALPIEDYVLASILSEVAPPASDRDAAGRIFEIQAIVARTYAAANLGRHRRQGFDLCDSTHCQVLDLQRLSGAPWRDVARAAAARTAGIILTYRGRAAQALFHADCGGQTSAADEVWAGTPVPYLGGRLDALPGGARHQSWRLEVSARQIADAVARDGGPSVGPDPFRIEILERDRAGRAVRVALTGHRHVTLRGTEFRSALSRTLGPLSLRSTRFTVEELGGRFVFEGQGFGHGVGLCQTGAAARARVGQSPREVLAFYYPGAELTVAASSRPTFGIPRLRPRGSGEQGP